MIVQGNFNLLYRPGLRKDFRDEWKKHPEEFKQFLRYSTTTMPEQTATIITGLTRFLERGDGEPITYEDPKMGPKVVGVDKEFALGFMITRRTVEDDQYNKANSSAKWLAHAAQLTKEYRAAGLLDDAFTGATYLGIDGLPLISTAHTYLNASGTISNRVSSDIGVSMTGVTAMLDLAQNMKDHNGDPIVMNLDTMIIGNNAGDYNRALQIFGSTLEPFTADNTENAIKKRLGTPRIIVSHYKQDANSWFMLSSQHNDAHFVMRRDVEFDDTFDFDTDVAKYKGSMRFLIWFVDWRGWFGSDPA
jgi:hypothetical protein